MSHVPGLTDSGRRSGWSHQSHIQHARVDLVRELDKEKIRYPDDDLGKSIRQKSPVGELEPM